ncbi:FtsX-like permease family protein [Halobellus rubicundus]|uniref:FtsX-like permease family protein n=1 Tax=Halobellus rubicundus TaxID=2996466 RepID=A0ABD5MCW4_9EURY
MGYRRALSFGWARRDTLAVVVIALTVAFLVGASLLGVTLGAQTTAIAAEFETTYELAQGTDAPAGEQPPPVQFTLGTVSGAGQRVTVIGIPADAPNITVRGQRITFPTAERGTVAAATPEGDAVFSGRDGVAVQSRASHTLLPDSWYVAHPSTARELGNTESYAIRSTPTPRTPLLSALLFFVYGSAELVDVLRLAAVGGGLLVGVTVFSVVRVTVRERRPDIAVLRSTGATPRQIVSMYGLRALVLTAIGLAVGYGFGLIFVRAVVNVALAYGLPTTLNVQLTPRVLRILVPAGGLFLAVGAVSGVGAAYSATAHDPQLRPRVTNDERRSLGPLSRIRRLGRLRLLGWNTLVPTAATLTVFMCALLVLTAVAGAFGPLASGTGRTITEPGTPHPVASNVPESYADALRAQGAEASPEILLFEVYRGDPIVARGVNFSAYRSFADIELRTGSLPADRSEALIGADLARSTGLSSGETIVIGGSTAPAMTRLEITGTFSGRGIQDDQLLVSLPTARDLANRPADSVHFVRVRGLGVDSATGSTVVVTDARLTRRDGQTGVVVSVTNLGLREATRSLDVTVGETTRTTSITLSSRRTTQQFVPFDLRDSETYRLVVGDIDKQAALDDGEATGGSASARGLSIDVPDPVPVNSTPQIVVLRGGTPVPNATVSASGQTAVTNDRGAARIRFESVGETEITATSSGNRTTETVSVTRDAARRPTLSVAISPDTPSIFTRPDATVRLANPWATDLQSSVVVSAPGGERSRNVTIPAGESTEYGISLPRQPPGGYTVTVTADAESQASTTYTVRGDERLGAALASSGRYTAGSGITRAIQLVFGNIEALVLAIVTLLAVMTVGSTTAALTRAVHTAKDEIGIRRATGATPRDVFVAVFADALKIGAVASVLAFALGFGIVRWLLSIGELRVFGLALDPVLAPSIVAGALGIGVGVAIISALLAAVGTVRAAPATLLVDRNISVSEKRGDANE